MNDNHFISINLKKTLDNLNSGIYPPGSYINLAYNEIGFGGATMLANAISSGKFPPGSHLNLANNEIDDEACKALADAIGSGECPPGLHINLSGNKIKGGARHFA